MREDPDPGVKCMIVRMYTYYMLYQLYLYYVVVYAIVSLVSLSLYIIYTYIYNPSLKNRLRLMTKTNNWRSGTGDST